MSSFTNVSASAGGQKKSPLWLFFKHDITTDKTVCQVDGCKWQCSGKNPTFPKAHLAKTHPAVYKELEAKLVEEKANGGTKRRHPVVEKGQTKTTDFFKSVSQTPFSSQHPEQLQLVRKMAIAFSCSNIPSLASEDPAMREWIASMNSKFVIPGRGRLEKEYQLVYADFKIAMIKQLQDAHNIQVITDIWSKRGLSESFLGVRIRFFCLLNASAITLTIAARKFPSPHTGKLQSFILLKFKHSLERFFVFFSR